jgi:hypothetical protein
MNSNRQQSIFSIGITDADCSAANFRLEGQQTMGEGWPNREVFGVSKSMGVLKY